MAPPGLTTAGAAVTTGIVALGISRLCGFDLQFFAGKDSFGCLPEVDNTGTCEHLSNGAPGWGWILLVAFACDVIVMLCITVCCCRRRRLLIVDAKPCTTRKSELIEYLRAGIDVQSRLSRSLVELCKKLAGEGAALDGEPIAIFDVACRRVQALLLQVDADPLTRLGISIEEFWEVVGRHDEQDPDTKKVIAAWRQARSGLVESNPLHTAGEGDEHDGPLPQNLQTVNGVMAVMNWMLEDLDCLVLHVQRSRGAASDGHTTQMYDKRVVALSANVAVEARVLAHFQVCGKDITQAVRKHREHLESNSDFIRVNNGIIETTKKLS